jgi:hypothetical protein
MRQAQPNTSLAEAQTALAQQYGFPTWPELKAEADRRQGRGEIGAPGLAQRIAASFGLGSVTGPMRSSVQPNETGREWMLETDGGRWSVKQLQSWYGIDNVVEHAETDVRLQEAALAAGMLLPRPVRSRSGGVVETIEEQSWRVNAWIAAGPPLSAPVRASIASRAGRLLAQLHALRLRPERPMEAWYTAINTPEDWSALAASAAAQRVDWAPALEGLLVVVSDLWRLATCVAPPPTILCHCGFGLSNVRVARDGTLAVLGWEHAGAFPPSWELAGALLAWSVGPHADDPDVPAARALVDGYEAASGSPVALDLTCFGAHAAAWLNYAYGQVRCALETSDIDERRAKHRGVRHLLQHAPRVTLFERVLASANTSAG